MFHGELLNNQMVNIMNQHDDSWLQMNVHSHIYHILCSNHGHVIHVINTSEGSSYMQNGTLRIGADRIATMFGGHLHSRKTSSW